MSDQPNFDTIDDNALLLEQTLAKFHQMVHGDASIIVQTDGGPLPSFARYLSMLVPSDKMVIDFGASGTLAERANWGNAEPGFTYLATDVGYVYTRLYTPGWSTGVAFRATQWTISTRNPLSVDGIAADIWLNKNSSELFTKSDATTWVSKGTISSGISDASVDGKKYVRSNGQWVELVSADAAAITALQTASTATNAALAAETQSRIDGETALTNTLEAYVNAAVTNNTNADNAETVARVAADNLIKGELDLSQASIGLNADGSLKAFTTTNYVNAATTIANAIALLDTALKAENTRALAAESGNGTSASAVATNLATEVTNRTNADSTLSTAISTETTNRQNAVTAANTAISNEVTRATNAEGVLTTAVATLNTNAVLKTNTNVFTKAQSVTPSPITYAATMTPDATLSNTFRATLTGNSTIANPTGMVDGQVLNFILRQDASGNRTVAWGAKFKWAGGTAPVLSTTAAAVDVVCGIYDSVADVILASLNKAFS